MMIKRFITFIFLCFVAPVASASSLDLLEADPNGAMGQGSGILDTSGGTIFFTGFNIDFSNADGSSIGVDPYIVLIEDDFLDPTVNKFSALGAGDGLLGELVDTDLATSSIAGKALYRALSADNSFSDFVDYFIVEFSPLSVLGQQTFPPSDNVLVKISTTTPIPLPAGFILIATSCCSLALFRRRRKSAI